MVKCQVVCIGMLGSVVVTRITVGEDMGERILGLIMLIGSSYRLQRGQKQKPYKD